MTVWVERYNPVCHAFHHADDNLLFPAAECLLIIAFPFFGWNLFSVEALQLVLQLVCAVVYRYLVVVGAKQERVAHIIQKSEAFHIRAATFVFQVLEVEVSRNGRIHNQNVRLINA